MCRDNRRRRRGRGHPAPELRDLVEDFLGGDFVRHIVDGDVCASSASPIAIARPIPRDAPVTNAVRPVSFIADSFSLFRSLFRPRGTRRSLARGTLSGLTHGVRLRIRTSMGYVIKRYSNRKLYDTQESRYVTLEEIEEMIRAGREISVVDAARART